jgi:hypothetical protein
MKYEAVTDISEDCDPNFIYPEDGTNMSLQNAGEVYKPTWCHIPKDRNIQSLP